MSALTGVDAYRLPGRTHIASLLADAFDCEATDEHNGAGTGKVSVPLDAAYLASARPDDIIAFEIDDGPVVEMIYERLDQTEVAVRAVDLVATLSGRGVAGLLTYGLIYPTGGVGREPVERDRSFTWTSLAYDDSAWDPAEDVSGDPGPLTPESWPGAGVPIAGPSGTPTFSPGGRIYFRQTFTLPADQPHVIIVYAVDNAGRFYLDGIEFAQLPFANGSSNRRQTHTYEPPGGLSAGTHVLAGFIFQQAGSTPEPGDVNPAWARWGIYTSDEGEPDELLAESDTDVVVLEYPSPPPGMTPGQALNICLDECHDRDEIPFIEPGFTDAEDSASEPWPVVGDIATKVGTDLLTFLRELSATYVDFAVRLNDDADGWILDAWVKGTRGSDSGVTIERPVVDPSSGSLASMSRVID